MSFKERFWPNVKQLADARAAAYQGAFACAGIIVFTVILFAVGSVQGNDWIWDAAIFAALGFGIYKFSRFAAVAALLLYWLERALIFSQQGEKAMSGFAGYLIIIFTFAFINGIRGTFAYRRLLRAENATATVGTGSPGAPAGFATHEIK
jgi:hypothetical protein